MTRPSAMSWFMHTKWRAPVLFTLVFAILAAQIALPSLASASAQDLYAQAYSLNPALDSSGSTFLDTTTNVTSFTRDTSIEVDNLSNCGGYTSGVNTYSAWYTYTPVSNGWFTVNTLNGDTNYDTVLEIWSGSVATANSVACNDDAIAGNRRSEITLEVTAGTTYIISVRRFGSSAMPATPQLSLAASFNSNQGIYVDQTNGSDNNTGSQDLPFRSIGKAVSVLLAAGGIIHIIDPGTYNESVTVNVPTVFDVPSSAVTIASLTLTATPVSANGTFTANTVAVQTGGTIQNGIDLIRVGGTVSVGNGTYTENVIISRNVTLRASNDGGASIQPSNGDAVTISAGTVTVSGFNLTASAGSGVKITGGSNHTILRNNIDGNTNGVNNTLGVNANAQQNYWGAATGPNTGGDTASANVVYRPWCTTPLPACSPLAGNVTQLVFNPSPSDSIGGAVFPTQPVIEAQDDFGNIDPSYSGTVILSIDNNPGSGTLSGTTSAAFVNGTATFTDLSIDKIGTGYTLKATNGSLNGTSSPFNITAGPASQLVFSTSPSDSTAGTAFPTQPVVTALDAGGNVATTFVGMVNLSIDTNPGSGSLFGTTSVVAINGVASFSGLSIDKTGTGYTLNATDGSLNSTSGPFNITAGPASQLVFKPSPSNSTAGTPFPTQPVIEVQDSYNNVVASYNSAITLSILNNPGGGTLAGTATVNAVNGVATFTGLSIDKAGTAYTLQATDGSLTGISNPFNISAGTATQLVFSSSPSDSGAGAAFAIQPVVQALDTNGNLDTTFNGAITLAIKDTPPGASLSGIVTVNAVNGIATFAGLNINKVGIYQLTANAGGLTEGISSSFEITVGVPHHLIFSGQPPTSQMANSPFIVNVTVVDQYDNTVTSATDTISLAYMGGDAAAVLTGGAATVPVNGVATFSIALDRIGTSYQLIATYAITLPGSDTVNSSPFNVTADRLQVTTSPTTPSSVGDPLTVVVQAVDGYGTVDLNFTNNISLAIQNNPTSATLQGTTSKAAVSGIAAFGTAGDANIQKVGTGYTLRANSGSLQTADSSSFDIIAGAADHVVFSVEPPSTSTAGTNFNVAVQIVDQYGNDVTSATAATVALTLTGGSSGATLTGGSAINFTSGTASFVLSVDKAGSSYQLVPTVSPPLPGTNSSSHTFDITAGTASQLVFSSSPTNTRAGSTFSSQPVVSALDAFGNTASGFSGSVTLAIKSGTGTSGANLNGVVTINAVNGVAAFNGLSIDKIGQNYQLTASNASLIAADSTSFNITASGLVFTVEPVTTSAGQPIIVKVAAQDASNTTDTTFNGAVTLTLKTLLGPSRAPLLGTVTINAVNGVADFSSAGLHIDRVGTGYLLTASTADLSDGGSTAFDITPGPVTQLQFTTQPVNTAAGAPIKITIEAQDAFGNLATTATDLVSIAIATNPGGGTLGGTTSKALSGGTVSFDTSEGLNIDRVGVGYVLVASSGALTPINSSAFNITASQLIFSVQPGKAQVGWAFGQQPVVRAVDAFGTVDTTFNGMVTLAIANGTGTTGTTLKGSTTLAFIAGQAIFHGIAVDRVGTDYQLTANNTTLPSATSQAFTVERATISVPIVVKPPQADLVGTFSISSNPIVAFERTQITVTITNKGEAPSDQFWVDFYINPTTPPSAANQPWNTACGGKICPLGGIAWYVNKSLAPGESITLTSTPNSFNVKNSVWKGYFTSNNLDLYLYVDSWNPGVYTGAVSESNETNNRAEFHWHPASTSSATNQGVAPEQDLPALPERPVRPE